MRVAAGIVSRNSLELADELYAELSRLPCDVVLLENGTAPDFVSSNASIIIKQSNGISWAVNHLIGHFRDSGYDLAWINYNDARYVDAGKFLDFAKAMFNSNSRLAVITGYWENVWSMKLAKNPCVRGAVPFFDPLGFFVRLSALKDIKEFNEQCAPFWDSLNYTGHFGILAPALALYSRGWFMYADPDQRMYEKNVFVDEHREELSQRLRGFSDKAWKEEVGPQCAVHWLQSYFGRDVSSKNMKSLRDAIMSDIATNFEKYVRSEAIASIKI